MDEIIGFFSEKTHFLAKEYINVDDVIAFCIYLMDRSLRWLDTVFQGQYLPRLSVNYVAINKDLEKLTPQLY